LNIPQEAIDVRNKLLKTFSHVGFTDEGHKYTVKGHENENIESVSTVLHNFYDEFDEETILPRYAASRGFTEEQVRAAWQGEADLACWHGSNVHLCLEQLVRHRYFGEGDCPLPIDKQSLGGFSFINSLPEHLVPIAVETSMFSEKYYYTGTMDLPVLNLKTKKLWIMDYKGLAVDTPIFTSNGWKTMGTLTLEDKVWDKDGKICNIKHISAVHHKRCIKLRFNNSEEIVSDFDHRWLVSIWQQDRVMTSEEILKHIQSISQRELLHSQIVGWSLEFTIPNL